MRFHFRAAVAGLAFTLASCGGGGGGQRDDIYEPVTPAVTSAPYASALADCTFNAQRKTSCSLDTLPFLGQEVTDVTLDKLMERVISSKPWMAERLREVLSTLPPEVLTMTRPITAVVIGSKIRPSFYDSGTGAIYLDPAYLWLTQAELATIDKQEDYRADFGADLQFTPLWRYVINNDYAYYYYPLDFPYDRPLSAIQYPVARLLFHELAHAADFMPPSVLDTLPREGLLSDAMANQDGQRLSDGLVANAPLTSTVWQALADVLYRGTTADAVQKAYTPADVADAFAPDRASDAYAYSTQYEDLAMLTEEALMHAHFGIERDFAITNLPSDPNAGGEAYIVSWGVRGRVREPRVTQGARYALHQILPGSDYSAYFDQLQPPTPMQAGLSWTDNLSLATSAQHAGAGAKYEAGPLRLDSRLPPE